MSVPISSNVGKAPVKVKESTSFSVGADGVTAPSAPIEIPKQSLGTPEKMDTAAKGSIPPGGGMRAVATYIMDGDTAILKDGENVPFTCRIDTIDTPETQKTKLNSKAVGQPYGEEATKYLEDMIKNKEVNVLRSVKVDKHGRYTCQIEFEGKNVDTALLQQGLAYVYRRYVQPGHPRRKELIHAEREARTNKLGVFSGDRLEKPEAYRHRVEVPNL